MKLKKLKKQKGTICEARTVQMTDVHVNDKLNLDRIKTIQLVLLNARNSDALLWYKLQPLLP